MENLYITGNFANLTSQRSIDDAFLKLKELSLTCKKIFWIPGPKEYLCDSGRITIDFVNKVMKGFCGRIKNLIVLNDEYYISDSTLYFGSILWEPVPDRRELLNKIYRYPDVRVDDKWITREYAKSISHMVEAMLVAREHNLSIKILTTFPCEYSSYKGDGWVFD